MLFTQCIYDQPIGGGIRISVMSRHTENDGITPDLRIKDFDVHIPMLGPSPKLIGDYYKRGISWKFFTERYEEELRSPDKIKLVRLVASLALQHDIYLLCKEKNHTDCHRSLLAHACLQCFPELNVTHC